MPARLTLLLTCAGLLAVELGDALALGRILGQALEPARGPQRLALGFETLVVEVGHQSCSRPSAPT
jgi:hypothetical protein